MKSLGLLILWLCSSLAAAQAAPAPPSVWPAITQTAKPWTRWWWPGSAVDRANITAQLEAIAAAGIGGVEITPIYGARGSEARYLDFLSPQLGGDARAHDARGPASGTRRGHGHRHRLAIRRPDGERRRWLEQPGAARWQARRQAHRDEGEAGGAGRRRTGARSLFDRRARSLPAPLLQGVCRTAARRRAGRGIAQPVPRLLRVLQRELDGGVAGGLPEDARLRHPDITRPQLGRRAAARRRHAEPHQGRLPAHARETASRLRERVGDLGA